MLLRVMATLFHPLLVLVIQFPWVKPSVIVILLVDIGKFRFAPKIATKVPFVLMLVFMNCYNYHLDLKQLLTLSKGF